MPKLKILQNLDLRLVSLALAVILWLHAATEREYTVAFNCPLAVLNIPQGYVLAALPKPVACDITATGKDLVAFKLRTPQVVVDAGNRQVRNQTFKLTESVLQCPFGLAARQVAFAVPELVVKLDRLGSKTVLLLPDLTGQPAEGFAVSDSTGAVPDSVALQGPEKLVEQIDTLLTEPVRIDELRQAVDIRARVVVPDFQLFAAAPESATVRLRFEKTGERLFKNQPIALANRGQGYLVSFSPGTVDIVIAGPQQLLQGARPEDIKVFLDLKDLARGSHQLQAVIELPDRLEMIAANPRIFEVSIR